MTATEVSTAAAAVESKTDAKGPVVLQVLPSLVTGGVERGAVDIAGAIIADGGTAIVASEGGLMENDLKRLGVLHLKMPLASKNPWVMQRNVTRLAGAI